MIAKLGVAAAYLLLALFMAVLFTGAGVALFNLARVILEAR